MEPVYLDYASTTPVDERVARRMADCLTRDGLFANPASRTHAPGRAAADAVEQAREQVATAIGGDPRGLVFTSGATEADNLALKGVAGFQRDRGRHIVTASNEHKAVLDVCRALEFDGFEVTRVQPMADGSVTPEAVEAALRPDTVLVSVMHANNETGTLNDIGAIARVVRDHGARFHIDAAQTGARLELDVDALDLDLVSLSAHKTYGPKGIGALYVRRRPRARLEPLMDGGGQERGLRSGTVPAPLAVGLGAACRIAGEVMADERAHLDALYRRLRDGLMERVPDAYVNGDETARIPGNLNICIPGLDAETLIEAVPGLALSTASACSSAAVEPSYVLSALGLSDADAAASLRIGLGRYTTADEVDRAVAEIAGAAQRLRDSGATRLQA